MTKIEREATHTPATSRSDGFTLVELLVSLSILSMLVALSVQGVRLISQLDRMLDRQNAMQNIIAIETLLRNKLENAVPLVNYDQNGQGSVIFEGHEDRIFFVSASHGETTDIGIYLASINVATDENKNSASLAYSAWKLAGGKRTQAKKQKPHHSFSGPISKLRFSYFGPAVAGQKWQNKWLNQKKLPNLIRVEIEHEHYKQTPLRRTIIVRLPN